MFAFHATAHKFDEPTLAVVQADWLHRRASMKKALAQANCIEVARAQALLHELRTESHTGSMRKNALN